MNLAQQRDVIEGGLARPGMLVNGSEGPAIDTGDHLIDAASHALPKRKSLSDFDSFVVPPWVTRRLVQRARALTAEIISLTRCLNDGCASSQ